ncbi:DUF4124 domain-containing protein [Vibrio rotiferianus]|uniref:DUF4124 domain-containing protein n=1 Tax=Vibrio TaxID=662 RepID=UPI00111011C2|nr:MULTISPECIES: DUF4124 domain-containing protein [Vibrio]TMX65636.1 nitrogen regulation protein NR [Vibrio rotiferianus]USD50096.1 DUF4124 domain-containing protein [Vibrio sp. SCSIO 43153]CAH1528646.1 Nitrogen regulation protein NR [Vibrio rotiferianus]CAH1555939.1 Nitrogen regulation protein NR [Vibrio rotiferianus]
MKVQLLSTLIILGGLVTAASPFAQVAYTWVDKDGVIHFSDTPQNGAKAIALPDLQGQAPAPKVESTEALSTSPPPNTVKKDKPKQPEAPKPLSLAMLTPVHDETIRSNQGLINIQLEANRKLGIGEQLQLMLDGKPYAAPQTRLTWQINNIDRGTHTLAVHAKRSGKLIASTSPITVHLHRASVKPKLPRPKPEK